MNYQRNIIRIVLLIFYLHGAICNHRSTNSQNSNTAIRRQSSSSSSAQNLRRENGQLPVRQTFRVNVQNQFSNPSSARIGSGARSIPRGASGQTRLVQFLASQRANSRNSASNQLTLRDTNLVTAENGRASRRRTSPSSQQRAGQQNQQRRSRNRISGQNGQSDRIRVRVIPTRGPVSQGLRLRLSSNQNTRTQRNNVVSGNSAMKRTNARQRQRLQSRISQLRTQISDRLPNRMPVGTLRGSLNSRTISSIFGAPIISPSPIPRTSTRRRNSRTRILRTNTRSSSRRLRNSNVRNSQTNSRVSSSRTGARTGARKSLRKGVQRSRINQSRVISSNLPADISKLKNPVVQNMQDTFNQILAIEPSPRSAGVAPMDVKKSEHSANHLPANINSLGLQDTLLTTGDQHQVQNRDLLKQANELLPLIDKLRADLVMQKQTAQQNLDISAINSNQNVPINDPLMSQTTDPLNNPVMSQATDPLMQNGISGSQNHGNEVLPPGLISAQEQQAILQLMGARRHNPLMGNGLDMFHDPMTQPMAIRGLNPLMGNGLDMFHNPFWGIHNPELRQELMFGDTTDPPDIPDPVPKTKITTTTTMKPSPSTTTTTPAPIALTTPKQTQSQIQAPAPGSLKPEIPLKQISPGTSIRIDPPKGVKRLTPQQIEEVVKAALGIKGIGSNIKIVLDVPKLKAVSSEINNQLNQINNEALKTTAAPPAKISLVNNDALKTAAAHQVRIPLVNNEALKITAASQNNILTQSNSLNSAANVDMKIPSSNVHRGSVSNANANNGKPQQMKPHLQLVDFFMSARKFANSSNVVLSPHQGKAIDPIAPLNTAVNLVENAIRDIRNDNNGVHFVAASKDNQQEMPVTQPTISIGRNTINSKAQFMNTLSSQNKNQNTPANSNKSPSFRTNNKSPSFRTNNKSPSFRTHNKSPAFRTNNNSPSIRAIRKDSPTFIAFNSRSPSFNANSNRSPPLSANNNKSPSFRANRNIPRAFSANTNKSPSFRANSNRSPSFSANKNMPARKSFSMPKFTAPQNQLPTINQQNTENRKSVRINNNNNVLSVFKTPVTRTFGSIQPEVVQSSIDIVGAAGSLDPTLSSAPITNINMDLFLNKATSQGTTISPPSTANNNIRMHSLFPTPVSFVKSNIPVVNHPTPNAVKKGHNSAVSTLQQLLLALQAATKLATNPSGQKASGSQTNIFGINKPPTTSTSTTTTTTTTTTTPTPETTEEIELEDMTTTTTTSTTPSTTTSTSQPTPVQVLHHALNIPQNPNILPPERNPCPPDKSLYQCRGKDLFINVTSIGEWCYAKCSIGQCVNAVCECSCNVPPVSVSTGNGNPFAHLHIIGEAIASALTGTVKNSAQTNNALNDMFVSLKNSNPELASRVTADIPGVAVSSPQDHVVMETPAVHQPVHGSATPNGQATPDISALLGAIERMIDGKISQANQKQSQSAHNIHKGFQHFAVPQMRELILKPDSPTTTPKPVITTSASKNPHSGTPVQVNKFGISPRRVQLFQPPTVPPSVSPPLSQLQWSSSNNNANFVVTGGTAWPMTNPQTPQTHINTWRPPVAPSGNQWQNPVATGFKQWGLAPFQTNTNKVKTQVVQNSAPANDWDLGFKRRKFEGRSFWKQENQKKQQAASGGN